MCFKNTRQAFGGISKAFHWGMALVILGLLILGYYMVGLEFSPFMLSLYGWHKSFGILVLGLIGLRILWQVMSVSPDGLSTHRPWEKLLSKLVKLILYVSMIGMPMSGWLMSSAGGFPAEFFGLFELPHLVAKDKAVLVLWQNVHLIFSYTLLGVLALHIAGALKHHFVDKDDTLRRMVGGFAGSKVGVFIGGVSLLLLLVSSAFAFWPYLAKYAVEHDHSVHESVVSVEVLEAHTHEVHDAMLDKNISGEKIWLIDYERSGISFEATQYGASFDGQFERFDGVIVFDPENLAQSRVNIEIDIGSIKTGSDDRDNEAVSISWFETELFPKAYFQSTSFEKIAANRYVINADLTVRGIKLPVKMLFSLQIEQNEGIADRAVMEGDLTINRLDFGVGKGRWDSGTTIGNPVKIHVFVTASLGT